MPEYDAELFNQLYNETAPLRKKLASTINPHKMGLQYEDVLSFFDDKFILVFQKYHQEFNRDVLKGHIISALSRFRNRILRHAYQKKYENRPISIDDEDTSIDIPEADSLQFTIPPSLEPSGFDLYRKLLLEFMYNHLSHEAWLVFQTENYPPPYVLSKLQEEGKKTVEKVPARLISDFLGWGTQSTALRFIGDLRAEIKEAVAMAKNYFREHPELVYGE